MYDDQTKILFQTLITSIALPFVISLLKNTAWSTRNKQIFALAFSVVATFGLLLFDNKLGRADIILTILITVISAQGNYKLWFEGSAFDHVLSNLFSSPKPENNDSKQNIQIEE